MSKNPNKLRKLKDRKSAGWHKRRDNKTVRRANRKKRLPKDGD